MVVHGDEDVYFCDGSADAINITTPQINAQEGRLITIFARIRSGGRVWMD